MTKPGDCCSDYDPDSLSLERARAEILAACQPLASGELLSLWDALERTLRNDVTAPIDVPPYINSAMDGYAVRADDIPARGEAALRVAGRSLAGHPYAGRVQPGEAVRITTGAVVPEGGELVVMQEHVRRDGDVIHVGGGHRRGQHLRAAGSDIAAGTRVLCAGHLLKAADLGLLASLGMRQVEVVRKARVTYFSTGDELVGVGQRLKPGEIHDSNRYTLHALLTQAGCTPIDLGVVGDDPGDLEARLRQAAGCADVVITTGGVSVGEADYVKQVLEALGVVNFWKIAMKPGRPLTFGRIEGALFFGLPGNPVSVMATFYQLVVPALRKLHGRQRHTPLTLRLKCLRDLRKQPGRIEFQRGVLVHDGDEPLAVDTTGEQDSHILSSMSRADCFIVLPADSAGVAAGELVDVQLIQELH